MRTNSSSWLLTIVVASSACLGGGQVLESEVPESGAASTSFGVAVSSIRLPAPAFDFSKAIDANHGGIPHGHGLRALHRGSHGLSLVGYHPLTGLSASSAASSQDSGYTGLAVWKHFVCVTQFPGPGGASIVDIQNPARPTVLSTVASGMANWECEFTADGDYLLLAAYQGPSRGLPGVPPPAGDAAAGGFSVYDVRDKRNPIFLFHDDTGSDIQASHAPYGVKIGDTNYVFHSYTGHILALEPAAKRLRIVATVPKAGHDVWAGRHPVTGDWILAHGPGCDLVLYNINDPAHPVELDTWSYQEARKAGFDRACADHWRWPLANTIGGRAYMVVVGAEINGATIPFTVVDITDPQDLFTVGQWEIPGRPVSPPPNFYTFGGTQYETWDGYVAAGIMHAGVWVFDIGSPERLRAPTTIGYYLPDEDPVMRGGLWNKPFAFNPLVWSAVFDERGYVLAADHASGLYILKFGATRTE